MPTAEVTRPVTTETQPKEPTPGGKRVHDFLNLATKVLPVAGAVGTLFVWLTANFYVGDVQVAPDHPFNAIEVKVSDKRGQEATFHTPKFQLMPGNYHVQVAVDSQSNQHADIKVVFHRKSLIPISMPQGAAPKTRRDDMVALGDAHEDGRAEEKAQPVPDEEQTSSPPLHRHWWQFWKRTKRSLY
jgi:hypothetical protein